LEPQYYSSQTTQCWEIIVGRKYESIVETIGNTPVVRINRLAPQGVNVFVKIEAFNPLGSVKDRLALGVIEAAEKSGELKPGQTVIEATSGNTGIGLAMVCAAKGYPLVITMAEPFSVERRKLMRFLGAKVIVTPAAERAVGMINKTIELAPQFAKAYGDRGIVRLMRGENAQAELDFKKCFELDSTLQTQINAAASQIKQHAASTHEPEQPSDVKVVKFSWSEMPERILDATPSSIAVSTTGVSQTGTRVLAIPADKGDPGRPEVGLEPRLNPSTARSPRSPARLEETFALEIQNVGDKTIVGVRWTYFFYPKDVTHEATAFTFSSKTKIAPGKEKTLSEQGLVTTEPGHRIEKPTKKTRMLFNERVAIFHLDYADGSVWPSPRP